MIVEHYEAVQALLPPEVNSYLWSVPESPEYPYVVLWGSLGDELSENLADTVDSVEFRIKATYAAESGGALSWLVSKVRPALNRQRPQVLGWSPGRLRQSSLMDAQTDTKVTVPGTKIHPVFAVDEYELLTQRA